MQTFIAPFFFTDEDQSSDSSADHVKNYTCDLLVHALLWYSFRDAIREGGGPTVCNCGEFSWSYSGMSHTHSFVVVCYNYKLRTAGNINAILKIA